MRFEQLLRLVGDEPVFETGLLLAGESDPADVRRQLSRWTEAGKLFQLRRGLYTLAPPFQQVRPHPFLVANRMVRGSYVSLQSALAYHGLIPEHVPVTTSVGPGRGHRWTTPLGTFVFHHLKRELLTGSRWIQLSPGQSAFIAPPEKALLDLVYLVPGADRAEYLEQLRLQHLDQLDVAELDRLAKLSGKPKLQRAAAWIHQAAQREASEYESL